MKKIYMLACLFLIAALFAGCDAVAAQVETISQNIDIEAVLTETIDKIDWNGVAEYTQQGYDALTEQFPALKSENVKSFLKSNGLQLMNRYIESTDESVQEKARKLGEILKILNPELTDEVNSVISE